MKLDEFFHKYPRVALGFSGGVDSAYLLHAARKHGADVKPYFIKTQFQPTFEEADAKRLAKQVGADNLTVINADVLQLEKIAKNTPDRCYYCKRNIFGLLKKQAEADGYGIIIDGTNASDDVADRPGYRALQELGVLSPLREAGLTKTKIRELSQEAGLFTWNKPAYACLATRIPTGMPITANMLERIEKSEYSLMAMGIRDFRVRVLGEAARLQLKPDQLPLLMEKRKDVLQSLEPYFNDIYLDLKGR